MQPRKNLARLLEAWATVQARGDGGDAVLAIAGRPKQEAGGYAALADRLGIADTVRWLGYVADDDLPVLLAGARCLVFPSLYEGFGLPVVEAMAAGCPVITRIPPPCRRRPRAPRCSSTRSPHRDRRRHRAPPVRRDGARAAARARAARAAKLSWTRSAEVLAGVYTDVMSATARR